MTGTRYITLLCHLCPFLNVPFLPLTSFHSDQMCVCLTSSHLLLQKQPRFLNNDTVFHPPLCPMGGVVMLRSGNQLLRERIVPPCVCIPTTCHLAEASRKCVRAQQKKRGNEEDRKRRIWMGWKRGYTFWPKNFMIYNEGNLKHKKANIYRYCYITYITYIFPQTSGGIVKPFCMWVKWGSKR